MKQEMIGGLTVRIAGGTDGAGGGNGPAVVLLHGWGAPGNDLVPLWEVIDAPQGTKFFFPEGPLSLSMGMEDSRAWWMIDVQKLNDDFASGRPRNLSREVPKGLATAREHLLTFLKAAQTEHGLQPERTVLGGFSQGAMLSCDVALRTDLPFAAVALLSGTLLARDEWVPLMPQRKNLPFLQSHGQEDAVLPWFYAEQLRDFLTDSGISVEWVGFQGGHEIPPLVLKQLGSFLHKTLKP